MYLGHRVGKHSGEFVGLFELAMLSVLYLFQLKHLLITSSPKAPAKAAR